MENLIYDLLEKLRLRRKIEFEKNQKYNIVIEKELFLISSGKIFELDNLINVLEDMIKYNNQTKEIYKII